jgi:single-strand DNA-binding protein
LFFVGRLVRDPELRYTPNNVSVASFSIANNRSFVTGGEKRGSRCRTLIVSLSANSAILSGQYARKGKLIGITGRLQQRSWDDQDGKKRSKVEIIVENFQFLDSRGSEQHSQEGTPASAAAVVC